jgi:hypothetical protein
MVPDSRPYVVDRVSEALKPHYEAVAVQARRAQVNDMDETGWSPHGVLPWLWVMVKTTVAWFTVQASRSQAAFEALIAYWAGMAVSEGSTVYQHGVHGRHTCLAHLIRRARGLAERQKPELAWFGQPGHDGIAAAGALGPSAPHGGGGADLICTAGASAGPMPASERRGGNVGSHAGAGVGRAVDVGGGSRR